MTHSLRKLKRRSLQLYSDNLDLQAEVSSKSETLASSKACIQELETLLRTRYRSPPHSGMARPSVYKSVRHAWDRGHEPFLFSV